MGATPCPACPTDGTCCLDFQETLILLAVLSVLAQVALKIVTMVCCHLWRLLQGPGGGSMTRSPSSPPPNSTARPPRCPTHGSPRDRRLAHWELPALHRCLPYPLGPMRLTMDVNLRRDPPPCRQAAPAPSRHCCCAQAASAPSALPPPPPKPRPASVSCGTDARPASGVRFRQPSQDELAPRQRHQPTKVYIYPVHPETPPPSRDPSPGRREQRWKEEAGTLARGAGTNQATATDSEDGPPEVPASGHTRYYKGPEPSTKNWVYRPVKGPPWN